MKIVVGVVVFGWTIAACLLFASSGAHAQTRQIALEAIIADYQAQCDEFQHEIEPGIDDDLSAPVPKGILTVHDQDIYDIEIAADGTKATVVFASFHCSNFGYPWCSAGGSCTAYLIVDETVFVWEGGGYPVSVRGRLVAGHLEDTVLITQPVAGYACQDSEGSEGYGASPCYRTILWDEEQSTFWSNDGEVKTLWKFSVP